MSFLMTVEQVAAAGGEAVEKSTRAGKPIVWALEASEALARDGSVLIPAALWSEKTRGERFVREWREDNKGFSLSKVRITKNGKADGELIAMQLTKIAVK